MCAGSVTNVSASVNSNFPYTGQLSYSWSNDCGEEPEVTPADTTDASQINLAFSQPGFGQTVLCNVSVTVHNNNCQANAWLYHSSVSDECVASTTCSTQIEISPCVIDCNGVTNGPAQVDQCGVCDGDGTSCLGCNSTDITSNLAALDGLAFNQKALVRKATKLLTRAGGSKTKVDKANKSADALYSHSWNIVWSLPQVAVQCSNEEFCVQVNNSPVIADYTSNADAFKKLADSIAKKVIKLARNNAKLVTSANNILKKSASLHDRSVTEAQTVPVTTSACATASN